MRHRVFGKQLGRAHNQRQALLKGLVRSFFVYGRIQTTQAKAKSVSSLIEKLCSAAVKGDIGARQQLYRYLQDRFWVNNVTKVMAENFANQNSNFLRTTKIKYRQGDNSLIVKLSLSKGLDFRPQPAPKKEAIAKKSSTPKEKKTNEK